MTERRADLVVVGGGIAGLSTVLLARSLRPSWSVLLVDAGLPGRGATQWSAALCVSYGRDAEHRTMMEESLRLFDRAPFASYTEPSSAFVVVPSAERTELEAGVLRGGLREPDASELAAVRSAYPDLVVHPHEELLAATGGVFTVDVDALVRDALASASSLGCWSGSRVARIDRTDRGWGVETDSGARALAPRVAVATGPWPSPPVSPSSPAGETAIETRVKRVAALHLERARDGSRPPAVCFPADDAFLLAREHEILFSFHRHEWLDEDDALSRPFGLDDLDEGVRALAGRSPALSASVVGGRAFADRYTATRLPAVVADGSAPGLVRLVGGSGSGVRYAPALANRALERLCGQDDSNPTIQPTRKGTP